MPITESIEGNACRIECWNISESTAELEKLCKESGIQPINNFALEARYQQYMTTQLLFSSLFKEGSLQYKSSGKPYVAESDHSYVSISHSGNTVVMMKSQQECGVDIERIHSRVEKVKHKFLSDAELERVKDAGTYTLVQYWTAKEAMFKVHGSQDVFMRSNIFVTDVNPDTARAELNDGPLTLLRDIYFRKIDDMLLAWTEPYDAE